MAYNVGDIVHVMGLDIHEGKGKYAVFICVMPEQFFLINTESRTEYDCIPLQKKGRAFPEYDCFIGCKNIFDLRGGAKIDSSHGTLDGDELIELFNKVGTSRFISKIQRNPILNAIQDELIRRGVWKPQDKKTY